MPSRINHAPSLQVLTDKQNWPKWNTEMVLSLRQRGLGPLLRDANKPEDESSLQIWNIKQKLACAIVVSHLDPKFAKIMHRHKTLETLLRAIDDFTRPKGKAAIGLLCSLWNRLRSLSASRHKSIAEYCEEALEIQRQYARLGCSTSDPIICCAFLDGLPSHWWHWKYLQQHEMNVTCAGDGTDSSTFMLSNLVGDALEEDERLYVEALRSAETKYRMKIIDATKTPATVEIDFCTACNGFFHSAPACFKLNPQPRSRRKGNKRQRANSRELGSYGRCGVDVS
ncbi:hypothetical protein N7532_009532 [Penicillium argentinense]|uniref:Uncharacterized protein n=1 Tax=Penicillium argentinense TaxID=1131581 RepID=A0A9W9EZI5_9EURO|nr:uncharacterized protein N7532_009532 [Penicillium argentinense]KAJ5090848.1 hypothetical protein N7532_009532 [Penicillium argentinense]